MAAPYQITEERIKKAIENLKAKDYLTETLPEDMEYIKVVGEEDNKILYTLAILSRFEDKPLHVLIIARSGIGKSYIQKMILKLHPEEDWIRISSATKQVLYYVPKNAFVGKCISIDETSGVHEEAFYTVRTFKSEGKLELLTTEKDANGANHAKRKIVDGPVSILLSTTNFNSVDNETRSRMIVTYGDESDEQTKKIIDAEFFMNNTVEGQKRKKEIPVILQKHKDMMFVLRETQNIEFVYENEELEKRVKLTDEDIQSRRNISLFTTMIRCIARTRYFRRQSETKDGKVKGKITKEDVELAEKLIAKILLNQTADIKGSTQDFYNKICILVDSKRKNIPRNEQEFMGGEKYVSLQN
ncbi:MAG TPA: hypothetical protein DC049_08585 [Spirochaetia bacterium]|nr:hypothetical protein [Spirochaetia bacterium]